MANSAQQANLLEKPFTGPKWQARQATLSTVHRVKGLAIDARAQSFLDAIAVALNYNLMLLKSFQMKRKMKILSF